MNFDDCQEESPEEFDPWGHSCDYPCPICGDEEFFDDDLDSFDPTDPGSRF